IMRTFLQHPNVQPKMEAVTRVVQISEDKQLRVEFEPPAVRVDNPERGINPKTKRPYLKKVPANRVKPHDDFEILFDQRTGNWKNANVKLSNWIYPGIAGRYVGVEGSWEGRAARALILLLAPTVCLYLRLQGKGNNWVIAVPDVRVNCTPEVGPVV